jgi:ATP-dependent exoDNAse (exonuclease V) beta subunit
MNRPEGDPARPYTVAPGTHVFRTPEAASRIPCEYNVTWWDPHVLQLGAVSSFGLRRDDLIVKDGDMFSVEDRLVEYEKWRSERTHTVMQAGQPGMRVETATAWAAAAAQAGVDEEIASSASIQTIQLPGAPDRPRGPRFGTLVHAVLATVALDASDDAVLRTAETQGRILLSSADEVRAAATVVSAVLKHDLMTRAKGASRLRRETPVTWVQQDGTMIEGVLDLAFEENGTTTVVDFKTDHELAAGEARYRAQVQQYVHAVSRVTGRPAMGVLFRV